MTITINATKARQSFFDILLAARDKKQITKISLDGKIVAKLVPEVEKPFDWDSYNKKLERGLKYLRKIGWKENTSFRKNFKLNKW